MATSPVQDKGDTRQVFLYFGPLTFLIYLALPHGQLLDIATMYIMKDQLHASATQVALFRLITAVPVYLSFLFGLTRDLWNPFGLRDRGYFLIFGSATAAVFVWMALTQISLAGMFAGMLLVMISYRFVAAAYQGLMALVGQEKLMSGRLSALWNSVQMIPFIVGSVASGYIAEHLPPSLTFAIVAVLALLIAALGLWKPSAVFSHTYNRPQAKGADLAGDLKRLVKHRAIYPAIVLMLMFQFSPGANTPLQFYLTNEIHAPNVIFGYYYGIFFTSLIPAYLLYGFLCRKVSLNKLLWWGVAIAVPQMMTLAFIHSINSAMLVAIPQGLMGGMAFCALIDLTMRSCPPGLQGTLMMFVDGAFQLANRGGDLAGSKIYASSATHGFLYCAITATVVYALMLPVLWFVPKDLTATADGEQNPAVEAELLAEIAETDPGRA